MPLPISLCLSFFFFNDTATTEIYTLSLHDALPIWSRAVPRKCRIPLPRAGSAPRALSRDRAGAPGRGRPRGCGDRKSTRLNSSHLVISYAVFCLKKKNHTSCILILLLSIGQFYRPE